MKNVNNKLIPLNTYNNIEINKPIIYKDNKNKSGIYRWINKKNGKSYIGSSISLGRRFRIYYSSKAMENNLNRGSSAIYSALLKYGYSKFSLDILEYCEKDVLIAREQHYINLLKPQYNILKIARNRLEFKHSEATKIKMKFIASKIDPPPLSFLKEINHLLTMGRITTVVNKEDNTVRLYDSKRGATRELNISYSSLLKYINTNKLYKDIYLITSLIR